MREGNIFSLSTLAGGGYPHPANGGVTPFPGQDGRYPIPGLDRGLPHPRFEQGGTPIQGLDKGGTLGYLPPHPGLDGVPPPIQETEQHIEHLLRDGRYALAFTQKDFLVT